MAGVTYDSNGYINTWEALPDMNAPNPWAAMAQQSSARLGDATAAAANIPDAQAGIAQKTQNMNAYGQSTAAPQINYPALPNDYGLGKVDSGSQNAQSLHGANPWSLQGEALSR